MLGHVGRRDFPPSTARTVPTYLNAIAVAEAQPVVLIATESNVLDPTLTQAVAQEIQGNGGAFTESFLSDGAFGRAYGGDFSDLRSVPDIRRVVMIVLGKSVVRYSPIDSVAPGLRKAEVSLQARIYHPSRNFSTEYLNLEAIGAGFSDRDAFGEAARRLAERFRASTR